MTGDLAKQIEGSATEVALSAGLVDAAAGFIAASRAPRTRETYRRAFAGFSAWCQSHGRAPLPASGGTIAAWLADLAQQGRSPSTIATYLAAVVVAHRTAGHPIDTKNPILADLMRGIRNTGAHAPRQARPITVRELRDLLAGLNPALAGDARDRAILTLGWAAALRRSELVGLDWQEHGSGSGFLTVDEQGLVVTLVRSKASQSEAVTVVVPCQDMPEVCAAIAGWVKLAGIAPGAPLFRAVDRAERIGAERLTDRSVARIIQSRVRALALAKGANPAEAEKIAEAFSGHSLRAGYVTAAAAADVPSYRIQQLTRHKAAEMVSRYVREADKWHKGGLKGVW